jgi:hypothetical protein
VLRVKLPFVGANLVFALPGSWSAIDPRLGKHEKTPYG